MGWTEGMVEHPMGSGDRGFVANRWVNTGKRLLARQLPDAGPHSVRRGLYSLLVDDLLDEALVRVLCPKGDRDTLLGFIAVQAPAGLLFVYLVPELRSRGIGRGLVALGTSLLGQTPEAMRTVLHRFGTMPIVEGALERLLLLEGTDHGEREGHDGERGGDPVRQGHHLPR